MPSRLWLLLPPAPTLPPSAPAIASLPTSPLPSSCFLLHGTGVPYTRRTAVLRLCPVLGGPSALGGPLASAE